MATTIRPVISKDNKYYINKHRYYELKHFCLQYRHWQEACRELDGKISMSLIVVSKSSDANDPTEKLVEKKMVYLDKIKMIEDAAKYSDNDLWRYILKAVTEDLSFNYLKTKMEIPCGKDMYYDRYRKFFWIIDKMRK